MGVILTGMGGDGAKGLLSDERPESLYHRPGRGLCVVFGMPKSIKLGAVEVVRPLDAIAATVLTHVTRV